MSETQLIALVVAALCFRLVSLRRFWRLPLKQGEGWFLSVPVHPGFYHQEGARLLRRYRWWLVAPLLLEGLLVAALVASDRVIYALYEQFVGLLLSVFWVNFTAIQFAVRARALTTPAETPAVTAVQLSLTTRRLRDYSDWRMEAFLLTLTLLALLLLANLGSGWFPVSAKEPPQVSGLVWLMIWQLYLQAGLLLLKQLFVRWRMKLPLHRAEEYQRWREAWLIYHLDIFDAVRLLWALLISGVLLYTTLAPAFGEWLYLLAWTLFALCVVLFILYGIRKRRRLAVIEREIQPHTLVNEFPPTPVAEGKFLAGGLLYLNRDNPVVLARSPQGLAINLANRSTYLWVAYLMGLVLLVVWQASR